MTPLHSCVNRRRRAKTNTQTYTGSSPILLVCPMWDYCGWFISLLKSVCPWAESENTCPESCVVSGHLSAPLLHSPCSLHPLSSPLSLLFAQALIHIAALRRLLGCSFHSLRFQPNTLAIRARLDSKPILLPWPPLSSAFFSLILYNFQPHPVPSFSELVADSWSSSSSP